MSPLGRYVNEHADKTHKSKHIMPVDTFALWEVD